MLYSCSDYGMGVKLTMKPIGLDALVFLTNRGNPVGGEDIKIDPCQRVANSKEPDADAEARDEGNEYDERSVYIAAG
jgi:hypothetical protein